ncbi:substrate-binding domain-containing protein [Catenovulum sp. SM1970]|nr:phosphate ABC transporter substrate-binding/OmpA family protein [Marinifaba aquimaris]NTS77620.1 substrate-binding domain-containing protein [Marinifaba aquimaris]
MNKELPALKDLLKQLESLSQSELGIEISAQQMAFDDAYFKLVIKELSELEHPALMPTIGQIKHLEQSAQTANQPAPKTATNNTQAPAAKRTTVNKMNLIIPGAIAGFVIVLIAVFALFLTPAETQLTQPVVQQTIKTEPTQVVQTAPVVAPVVVAGITLPSDNAELKFRLHGSNTIGEKLAPALLEAYLKQQDIEQMHWVKGDVKVERTLQYVQNNTVYAIELHAHGSSTAFEDMGLKKADMGMASRRVKKSEAESLVKLTGNLNKVGNEHIIGLDGLAVIVNQNNPVKALSTHTLSRIFAGEIDNWSQIGGPQMPINVFSRDANSGTWDTFKSLVLKKHKKNLTPNATRLESSTELSTRVSQDESAIGFIGLNYIQHNKAVAVSEGEGTTPIFPTRFTIGTEDYALSRRLYFYTPTSASEMIKDFARFAISNRGQVIVEKTGLISQNIKVETVYPMQEAPAKYNQYADRGQRLSLNFRFDYGNKDLDNKGKRDLDRLIEFMESNPSKRIVLMGFSDSIGAKDKNKVLSLSRAKAVERELTSRGIPVMAVEGFGELLPIANNDNEVGRERNRRVEVWII